MPSYSMQPFETTIFAPTTPPYALCVKSVSVKVLKCADVTGMEHAAKGRRQRGNEGITGGHQDRRKKLSDKRRKDSDDGVCVCVRACRPMERDAQLSTVV